MARRRRAIFLCGLACLDHCWSADYVRRYSAQTTGATVLDLNANFIPYVVFGNEGTAPGYTTFYPKEHGMQPLSVMLVVCGDQLVYDVWGDTNGDDDKFSLVGEASLALATKCFGKKDIDGNHGHDQNDVLYIGFPGEVSETAKQHAHSDAKDFDDFEASIEDVGDRLAAKLG